MNHTAYCLMCECECFREPLIVNGTFVGIFCEHCEREYRAIMRAALMDHVFSEVLAW
jgi:hypothetical protein